jgi:hypothetical protein
MYYSVKLYAKLNPATIVIGKNVFKSVYCYNLGGSNLFFFMREFFLELFTELDLIIYLSISTSIKSS